MTKRVNKDKPHIRYLNMGPWPVFVGITQSETDFAKEMARLGIDGVSFVCGEFANATMHALVNRGQLNCIIAIQPKSRHLSVQAFAALVAHEATHAVQEIEASLYNEGRMDRESAAYLVQYITQEALGEFSGSNKVRRVEP